MTKLRTAFSRPLVFVGGKGGVGKTTIAAAVGLQSAAGGARTLLVSTDPAHSTSDVLGAPLGPDPMAVSQGLWAVELDPAEEADRYLREVGERVEQVSPPRLMAEVRRQLEVARASPGAEDAALFDRFTRLIDATAFERIVFDTAPSGQTLRLLSLPESMTDWVESVITQRRKVSALGRMWRRVAGAAAGSPDAGPDPVLEALEERAARFGRVRSTLRHPDRTSFLFVLVPERLPILETHRIVRALAEHRIPIGGVVVNQVLPDVAGDPFLMRRKERESLHLADIAQRFRDWPVGYLPLLDRDPVGSGELGGLLARLRFSPAENAT